MVKLLPSKVDEKSELKPIGLNPRLVPDPKVFDDPLEPINPDEPLQSPRAEIYC